MTLDCSYSDVGTLTAPEESEREPLKKWAKRASAGKAVP
jgi:hypothetical protein